MPGLRSSAGRSGFDDALKRSRTALGAQGVLHRLIAPLTQTLGDTLEKWGAILTEDLVQLGLALVQLRRPSRKAKP